MVIDSLKSFDNYINLNKHFTKVLEFLQKNDLHKLDNGKHVIIENEAWCSIVECDTKGIEPDSSRLETHDSFLDIHVLLEGEEIMGFKDRAKCNADNVQYNEADDIAFFDEDTSEVFVNYGIDNFIMVFPKDAHAPLMGNGTIRKAIFKVRV